jgi:hypothetical protein
MWSVNNIPQRETRLDNVDIWVFANKIIWQTSNCHKMEETRIEYCSLLGRCTIMFLVIYVYTTGCSVYLSQIQTHCCKVRFRDFTAMWASITFCVVLWLFSCVQKELTASIITYQSDDWGSTFTEPLAQNQNAVGRNNADDMRCDVLAGRRT